MNRVIAISILTFRAAWRSRAVHSALALVCAAVFAFALTARGDGTLPGLAKLIIEYSFKAAFWILAMFALWAGCGAVSEDIRRRHIQLLAVKPLRCSELWLGRWLGISTIIAIAIAICGILVGVLATVAGNTYACPKSETDVLNDHVLTARWRILPDEHIPHHEVAQCLSSLKADGTISERALPEDAWLYALQKVKWSRATVLKGVSKEWTFAIPKSVRPRAPNDGAWLKIRLRSPTRDREPTSMEWTFTSLNGKPLHTLSVSLPPDGVHYVKIPTSVIKGGDTILVRLSQVDNSQNEPLMFDPYAPLEILVSRSGFGGNLARALLIVGCQLSLVAAVGVTAGTAFSMPVAVFVTVCGFLVSSGAVFFTSEKVVNYAKVHDPEKVSAYARSASWVLHKLSRLLDPLIRLDPVQLLVDGIHIPWSATIVTCVVILTTYTALCFVAGVYLLKKKEVALPE